ncbi:MAG: trypsin-like peptidase domain-containing protein [Alistipes sp.]|jgi:Do/DeqQ family serine protease|nr:trypsin-like peptidase domain-containing protein [Alistipes sp.]
MKNKFLVAVAVIATAVIAGGSSAWLTSRSIQNPAMRTTGAVVNSAFDGSGAHFTSYTPQGYPDLTYAAENAVKAVVGVINTQEIPQRSYGGGGGMPNNPFFEFFGIPEGYGGYGQGGGSQQQQQQRRPRQQRSGGSGVIISPDGYIVTNHHVVDGADKLTVKLPGGKTYDAKLIGTDADTEIALIKIEETGLPSIPFGSSDELRLGEWVLAIGNPYELNSTVTACIVSAKARTVGAIQTSGNSGIEAFIQTDAAVNPGNSGGALVNTAGELVGINTLILSQTGSYAGYSFAVPETIVRKVTADLREFGVVQRALIGIMYTPVDDAFIESDEAKEMDITETGGILVREVVEDGAAQAAGIRVGDIVTSIDGTTITDQATVAEIVGLKRPGDVIKISAKRGGSVKQFDVTLRNRAGKGELLARESYDAIQSLGGELSDINLSERQKRELDIRGGIQVSSVGTGGLLARAGVRRGYIITHINGRAIGAVSDLYRITERIASIEGVYPDGKSVTYSLVE